VGSVMEVQPHFCMQWHQVGKMYAAHFPEEAMKPMFIAWTRSWGTGTLQSSNTVTAPISEMNIVKQGGSRHA